MVPLKQGQGYFVVKNKPSTTRNGFPTRKHVHSWLFTCILKIYVQSDIERDFMPP